jgi:hypothetical protein
MLIPIPTQIDDVKKNHQQWGYNQDGENYSLASRHAACDWLNRRSFAAAFFAIVVAIVPETGGNHE